MCSLGIGTASRSRSSGDGREDRRGVREFRKDDEPDRQKRRAADDGRIDHRQHAVGVRAHLPAIERIGIVDLAGGGGVANDGHAWSTIAGLNLSAASIEGTGSRHDPRVVARVVLPARGRPRVVFVRAVRIPRHRPERQRRDRFRHGGSRVHLLAVAAGVEQERPRPARGGRRQRRGVERQGDLVAGARNHEHVVDRAQQGAHVPFARIPSRRRFPGIERRHALIVVSERLPAVRRRFGREAARAQIGGDRLQPRLTRRRPGRGRHHDLIPEDAHARHDPDLARRREETAREIDRDRLRPADREAEVLDHRSPGAGGVLDLERGHRHRRAALRRGDVVARERVIGPAGHQQHGGVGTRTEIELERVRGRIAANRERREVIRVPAIERGDLRQHVVAVLVARAKRRTWRPHALELVGARLLPEPFLGIDVHAGAMIDGDELQAIDEQRFLELVGDAQLVAPVARAELVAADADVLVGIGMVPAISGPVAHLAAAHEVGHELEAVAVPGVEIRTRRGLAIELGDRERTRRLGPGRCRLGLEDARWPQYADDVRRLPGPEAEHDVRRGHRG